VLTELGTAMIARWPGPSRVLSTGGERMRESGRLRSGRHGREIAMAVVTSAPTAAAWSTLLQITGRSAGN